MDEGDRRPSLIRRIIAFPLTLLVIAFVMVAGTEILLSILFHFTLPKDAPLIHALGSAAIGLTVILVYKAYKRWIERAPDRELAMPFAGELGAGLLFGFLLFSGMTGIVALMGGFRITGFGGVGDLGSMAGLAMISGIGEEVMFRAIALRLLEKLVGTWGALVLTAAFFGAAHLGNPGATWFAALAIAMEAGILLGACYLYTRRLWLAIGVHAAWNFTQGWVFSVPVSGGKVPAGLFTSARNGPEWLTGGSFGLEASAVAMVVATVAGLVMLGLAVKRGAIMPPMWAR